VQENDIEAHPIERAHQGKIQLLKEEISVIRGILRKQTSIFQSISSLGENQPSHERTHHHHYPSHSRYADYGYETMMALSPSKSSQPQLSPTDPEGYRELLVQECLGIVDKRDREFFQMEEKAHDLELLVSFE
jgi:hypothetical protein